MIEILYGRMIFSPHFRQVDYPFLHTYRGERMMEYTYNVTYCN